jgi:hypothetical protein
MQFGSSKTCVFSWFVCNSQQMVFENADTHVGMNFHRMKSVHFMPFQCSNQAIFLSRSPRVYSENEYPSDSAAATSSTYLAAITTSCILYTTTSYSCPFGSNIQARSSGITDEYATSPPSLPGTSCAKRLEHQCYLNCSATSCSTANCPYFQQSVSHETT